MSKKNPITQALKGTGIELINFVPVRGGATRYILQRGDRFSVTSDKAGNISQRDVLAAAKSARVPVLV